MAQDHAISWFLPSSRGDRKCRGTGRPAAGLAARSIAWIPFVAACAFPAFAAVPEYRPGGVAPHDVGRALAQRPQDVGGCAGIAEGLAADRGPESGPMAEAASVERLLQVLSMSPTARVIMTSAGRRGLRGRRLNVCLDESTDLFAYYFSGLRVIGINASLTEGGRVAYLAHEIGHVPQHPRYSDNRYFPPKDLILLRRMREAAAEATAARIAWELRAAGYPQAWQEKEAGPYTDVIQAFEKEANRDSSARGLLSATRAAFDRWFVAAWRRDVYDNMTLEHLRRISGDRLGLVPHRRRASEHFLLGIGEMAGQNFLRGTEGPPLNDPFYAGGISDGNLAALHEILRDGDMAATPRDAAPLDGAVF